MSEIKENVISLIDLQLNTEDWSLGVSFSFWLLIGLIVILSLILLGRWLFGNKYSQSFEIDQAEIGVGDQKVIFKPNYTDTQVAYAIWVELSTRKIGLEIDFENDIVDEIYNSWYNFFSVTREMLKGISVSKTQKTSTRAIINLSVDVLNYGLRPHLTQWQARFRQWYNRELKRYDESDKDTQDIDPQELQKKFPKYDELKEDMSKVNKQLITYRAKMQQLVFRD